MDSIITRKDARALGLTFYFTGDECSKGHVSDHYVSTGKCVECLEEQKAEVQLQWEDKVADKAKRRERAKEALRYLRETLTELDESERLGLLSNYTTGNEDLDLLPRRREIAQALEEPFYDPKIPCKNNHVSKRITENGLCVACIKENRENYKPWARIYSHIRRTRIKEAGGYFSRGDIELLLINQNAKCVYCPNMFEDTGYHIDHIFPVCKGGSSWPENLQLLCPDCNRSKSGKLPEQYEKEIGFIRDEM